MDLRLVTAVAVMSSLGSQSERQALVLSQPRVLPTSRRGPQTGKGCVTDLEPVKSRDLAPQ